MGLMSFFKPDDKKKIEGQVKKIKEGYGQAEVRQEAMEALFKMGTPEALAAVLKRFTYVCQSLHWDGIEKKWLQDELIKTGVAALPALKEFIHNEENTNLAFRALERMVEPQEAVALLLSALAARGPDDYRRTQSKLELIDNIGARDFADPLWVAVRPYLDDHSDDVRAKVLEIIEGWRLAAAAVDVAAVLRDESASARVHRQAAQCLAALEVELEDGLTLPDAAAEDYVMQDRRLVRRKPS